MLSCKNIWRIFGVSWLVLGCSDGDPEPKTQTQTGALLPWAEGNTWTYRVTDDDGTVSVKTTRIHALEPVGGIGPNKDVMANKVVTTKKDGTDETQSWQAVVGNKVVRYRELSFDGRSVDANGNPVAPELEEHWDPFKLRIDASAERTREGASWLEDYEETKIRNGVAQPAARRRDLWQVIKTSEKVVVPAGEFDALVVQRTSGSDSIKQYWFVPGIGKVKETGGQTEELEDYEVQ